VEEALSRVVPDSNRGVILSIRHGQAIPKDDSIAQASFIAELFGIAA
jgi:hypothetical protein